MAQLPTILVVDDEPGICELLATFFERGGFNVEVAGGGWEALEKIAAVPPVLVLTDVRMELGDGIELLEAIQALPRPRPLVALMSGYADVTLPDVLNRGAVAFLSKPLAFESLVDFARQILLPRAEAWAAPVAAGDASPLVDRNFPSMTQALAEGALDFGLGGLFVQGLDQVPGADAPVRFRLTFAQGDPAALVGVGLCRWVRQSSQHGFAKGIGIEIGALEAPGRIWLLGHLAAKDPRSFVPMGRLQSS